MIRAASIAVLLASAALAQTEFVETFDGGNEAGWWWGTGNQTIVPLNGNPGAYLQDLTLASCCPGVSTGPGVVSPFTGDWRARNVTSVGVDLITLDASSGVGGRLVTVMLIDDAGTPFDPNDDRGAYFVGDENVPDPGVPIDTPAGWTSYDFAIDAQADATPPGWTLFDFAGPVSFGWPAVVSDVDVLRFAYQDPDGIYLFLSWDVGLDNARITTSPFLDLGGALAGSGGAPQLAGEGTLAPGDPVTLTLTGALPGASTTLVVGVGLLQAPFKGGVLVPPPDLLLAGLPVSGSGTLALGAPWPAGIPAGTVIAFQHWIVDAGGPKGLAASNGLGAKQP